MKKQFLWLAILIGLTLGVPSSSSAGILIKSSKLRSSVRTSVPRIRLGTSIKKSTAAASRLNPIRSGKTYGTPDSLKFISKAQKKYQKKLAKWHKKKLKAEKKLAKKIAKRKKKEAKLRKKRRAELKKQQEKLRKKREKEQAKVKDQRNQRAENEGGATSNNGSSESFGKNRASSSAKPRSFWSKFWTALVGRN